MGPKRSLASLAFSALVWTTGAALAADGPSDPHALQVEIEGEFTQAQTGDCLTACRALDSMRRATERLCAIDPGDACAKAQAKVRAATQRVHAACPECAAASVLEKERAEPPPSPVTPAPPPPAPEAQAQAEAPHKGGGCAGCTLGSGDGPDARAALLFALVALGARRRRRAAGSW